MCRADTVGGRFCSRRCRTEHQRAYHATMVATWAAMYAQYIPLRDIARSSRVTSKTVKESLINAGITLRPQQPVLDADNIHALYSEGMLPAVAAFYGIAISTARLWCKSVGVPINPRGGRLSSPIDFWRQVDKSSPDECWNWTGAKSRGYGHVSFQREQWAASRLSYVLTYGPIQNGLFVLHHCDNRACCNPNHLFLGTHQDNMDDMMQKGRHRSQRIKQEAA